MQIITGKILKTTPLSGGDINEVYQLECQHGRFVQKKNKNVPVDFFQKEYEGLLLLKAHGLPVPEVFYFDSESLLMEYLQPGKFSPEEAGRSLAILHKKKQQKCGLEYDNYIGSLKQFNGAYDNWASFYIEKRLTPQLDKFFSGSLNRDRKIWDMLFLWIHKNLQLENISLLHGDIWSGNLYYSANGPVFIDPAVYFGDSMVDVAFSELFGGFNKEFYRSYNEIKPLGKNYRELKNLYQIYPLLVHANLFGGSYYHTALQKAQLYCI
jgi:fructosamine-3-kinase